MFPIPRHTQLMELVGRHVKAQGIIAYILLDIVVWPQDGVGNVQDSVHQILSTKLLLTDLSQKC